MEEEKIVIDEESVTEYLLNDSNISTKGYKLMTNNYYKWCSSHGYSRLRDLCVWLYYEASWTKDNKTGKNHLI